VWWSEERAPSVEFKPRIFTREQTCYDEDADNFIVATVLFAAAPAADALTGSKPSQTAKSQSARLLCASYNPNQSRITNHAKVIGSPLTQNDIFQLEVKKKGGDDLVSRSASVPSEWKISRRKCWLPIKLDVENFLYNCCPPMEWRNTHR